MNTEEDYKKLVIHSEQAIGALSRVQALGDMQRFSELLDFYAQTFKQQLESVSK
jgi:hypothetical protein